MSQLRQHEVLERCVLSRTTLHRLVKNGLFVVGCGIRPRC